MKPERDAAARGAVVLAWRNFGTRAFRVDMRGKHAGPLRDAEKLGLCWWPDADRCALLPAAEALAAEYSGDRARPGALGDGNGSDRR
jgi:hypothetical protein